MKPFLKLTVFAAFLIAIFTLPAFADDNYSLDAFNERFNAATDEAASTEIFRDFVENGTDLNVVREVQARWHSMNPEAALAHARKMADKNPDSAKFLYLYGRLLDSDIEKIEIGRKVIAMAPEWPFGYRLMLATYSGSLLKGGADEKAAAKLETMLQNDGPLFEKLVEVDPKETYSYEFLSDYQIYNKDYEGAAATYERAKMLGKRWPSALDFIYLHIRMGQYDRALEEIVAETDQAVERGEVSPEEKQQYIDYYYTAGLYNANAFDELVRYKMTNEGWETDNGALYDIACAYARSGDNEKSFDFLEKAVQNGWERVEHTGNDEDLNPLHDDSRWPAIIDRTKANWEAGKPKRKEETLAAKVEEPSPDWTLEDADGKMVSLADLRGNILILDFWATWCGPCRLSMPVINEFVNKNNLENVKVFSVNVWEKGKQLPTEFMDKNNYKMTLLFGNDDLVSAYEIKGIPYLCVIDKEGNIRFKETGYSESLQEKLVWWTEDLL